MNIYLIQNNLKDDSTLVEKIKTLGVWSKYFPNTILVKSELTSQQLYEKISPGFEKDWIFIVEISKTNFWGIMPTSVWDWIKKP